MAKNLILRLRTRTNLLELLEAGVSGDWKVAQGKEKRIKTVQVFNWDGSFMLESPLDLSKTTRLEDGRLVAGLLDTKAKIVKCIPCLEWHGQNPVNYVEITGENQEENNLPLKVPNPPNFISDQSDPDFQGLSQVIESQYGEPIQLVSWEKCDASDGLNFIFREIRRGWYSLINMVKEDGKWVTTSSVLPSFSPVLDSNAGEWTEFTAEATAEDWQGFDYIVYITQVFPHTQLCLAGEDLIGEQVAEEALEDFGFYIPDSRHLPGFLCRNQRLKVCLCALNGTSRVSLHDDNSKVVNGAESILEAAHQLYEKLCDYAEQNSWFC
ncbi:MAG: hypothetical protein ACLFQ7_06910 [Phormidium sp.]